jgi:hypothetical protein
MGSAPKTLLPERMVMAVVVIIMVIGLIADTVRGAEA